MEDNKKQDDELKQGLENLEEVNVDDLAESDLDSVAGGMAEEMALDDCSSVWCCSNSN